MSVDPNKYKEVSVDIYLSQKGWHEPNDRMLVWMSTQNNAFTMLPKCAGSVTKGNVDALGLRAPNPADGGDPSDVPEPYVWRTLRAKLGAGATTVSVCAALQTGAGAEALYLDNVALHEQSTAGTCSPLGGDVLGFTRGASGNAACKPPRAAPRSRTLCGFEDSEARAHSRVRADRERGAEVHEVQDTHGTTEPRQREDRQRGSEPSETSERQA